MKQKEVTNILYAQLNLPNLIEIKKINNKIFRIFKSEKDKTYMVYFIDEYSESLHSDIIYTIDECYDWINKN